VHLCEYLMYIPDMPPQLHITPGIHVLPDACVMCYPLLLSERLYRRTRHEGIRGRL
jgi:hypothetical protein